MRKKDLILGLILCVVGLCGWMTSVYAQTSAKDWSQEYQKLKKEYDALVHDRDNILKQTKKLLEYKNKFRDAEGVVRQFDIEREQLQAEKKEVEEVVEKLKSMIDGLDEKSVKLTRERDEYKKSFEKASAGNIIGKETQEKIKNLQKEVVSRGDEIAGLEAEIRKLEAEELKKATRIDIFEQKLSEIKKKYKSAHKQNRRLEKKLKHVPKKFAEMARENRVLIKRTSVMHYNLGVFYTQKREFTRALTEFEKAIELNPEDGSSHFNLGYIYAEHLLNRPKAVKHFRQFLKLAKRNDEDVDWVKRYILTWQTWEGETPIK